MNNSPNFPGFSPASQDFKTVRAGQRTRPLWFDIDLSNARAGVTQQVFQIAGNTLYIDANPADGNAVLHFQDTNFDATSAAFFVGPGFIAGLPFTQISIENVAQAGKKIRVFYGVDLEIHPSANGQTQVFGTVGVSDSAEARSLAAQSFSTRVAQIGGAAGTDATVQLWNPVGTGKKLYVKRIRAVSGALMQAIVVSTTATISATVPINANANKLIGGAVAPVAQWGAATLAGSPAGGNVDMLYGGGASVPDQITFDDPWVCPPGTGLAVCQLNQTNDIAAIFSWYER